MEKKISIKEKLKGLNKPYFFTVVDKNADKVLWKHPTILISYPWNIYNSDIIIDKRQVVMIESGGFLDTPPKNAKISIEKQNTVIPDIVLTLDEPVKKNPFKYTKSQKKARIAKTVDNAYYALSYADRFRDEYNYNFAIMPVIQAYDIDSLVDSTVALKDTGVSYFAYGAFPTKGRTLEKKMMCLNHVEIIRDIVGKRPWLHALGISEQNLINVIKDYITSNDAASITRLAAWGKFYGFLSSGIDTFKRNQRQGYYNYIRDLNRDIYMKQNWFERLISKF